MFNIFNKQQNIEFFSIIPQVVDIAPILPAYNLKPNWYKKAQDNLAEKIKQENYGKYKLRHIAKCPGIFNLIRYGWVMTTWQDIIIKTNGDGHSFEWVSAIDQTTINNAEPAVGFHPTEYLAGTGGWKDSLDCVIKINSPWRVIIPKGYYLYESHVPHSEETRFTTVPGVLSREHGIATLNVQLQWHEMNGETSIKAGTPIAHYMLIPKKQANLLVTKASPEQIKADELIKLEMSRRFVNDKAKSKCIFASIMDKF
jgi:hypothetical protein